jgi:3-dehydroquinate synthase
MHTPIEIGGKQVKYYFNNNLERFEKEIELRDCIYITDANIAPFLKKFLENKKHIISIAGEAAKSIRNYEAIIEQLTELKVHKKCTLIGIGGGVITDLTGYIATTYMRGVSFGFIPTSLLAMVDASIGGKNGLNVLHYKNILGTIQQPDFIFFDTQLLNTLPVDEWKNGFAEVIKYACLFDLDFFNYLKNQSLENLIKNENELQYIIQKCVLYKNKIIIDDIFDHANRRLLNFGHTIGHAIESNLHLKHGYAIGIGMVIASVIASNHNTNDRNNIKLISDLLKKYDLPTYISFEIEPIISSIQLDKKGDGNSIEFILLKQIGVPYIHSLDMNSIRKALIQYLHESKC